MSGLRVAMVTGASRGIGLELVRQLVNLPQPPLHVIAACRKPEDAQALQQLKKSSTTSAVHLVKLDITSKAGIDAAVKEVQSLVGSNGINVLINNAAIGIRDQFPTIDSDNLMHSFQTNTMGPVLVTQGFLPLLQTASKNSGDVKMGSSRAAVMNISSHLGSIQNCPAEKPELVPMFSYKISKAGLNMATRLLSGYLHADNILVFAVCPGWVQTDMGGANAALTPAQSVTAILSTLDKVGPDHHGSYIQCQTGNILPW